MSAEAAPRPSWPARAIRELDAIRALLDENHPGPADAANPRFQQWLDEGHRQSALLAARAENIEGLIFAARHYVNGFHDGHLGYRAAATRHRWPGFTIARRNDRYIVHASDGNQGTPPPGSVLLDCDGRAPGDILKQDIFPFKGNEFLPGEWVLKAPLLALDEGNPFRVLPRRCRFAIDGRPRTLELTWRALPDGEAAERVQHAGFGTPPPLGLRTLPGGVAWLAIPTFAPDADGERELRRMIDALPRIRGSRMLVLDVRGNKGGSSQWALELMNSLYGPELVAAADAVESEARPRQYVEWRASPGNLRHLQSLDGELIARFGPASEIVREVRELTRGLAGALATRQPFFVHESVAPPARPATLPPNPVKARVVLLTDGRCASACLDLAAALLLMPGVVHAGAPTAVDTAYMDARVEPLPSGVASLVFAMKVYRHRRRPPGPYLPQALFDGDFGDQAAVERFVLALRPRD